ncbi:MAG: cation:proton antiporter [Blastocatellales bacterium]
MNHLLLLLLLLTIIILAAKAAGAISVRYGQPAVFGEILIGLLLGPTALNLLHIWPFSSSSESLITSIKDFSEIGVILLMFVAGLETDLGEMKRVGRVAFWTAVGGVLVPFFGGAAASRAFDLSWTESFFIGAVLTATSVSISAQTLLELKQIKSKEGSTILGAAVIDDVLGIIVLSVVVAFTTAGASGDSAATLPTIVAATFFDSNKTAEILSVFIFMISFFIASIWFGAKYFDRLLEKASKIPASQAILAMTVALVFFYAFLAQYIGQVAAITGSYIAGVLCTRTRFKKQIDEGIHPLTYSILVPVFFISIGLEADGRSIVGNSGMLAVMLVILGVAILGKILGCGVFARVSGFNNIESLRVGVGMVSRGEVGLIVAGVGLANRVIDQNVFSIMVIMVLVTTMITPLMLRYVFPRAEEVYVPDVYEAIASLQDKDD